MTKFSPLLKITNARTVKGAGRGKKLGIATVNFDPISADGLKEGIYVCMVIFPSASSGHVARPYWGVLHFGPRPVFGDEERSLEAHLFEFEDGTETKTADIEIYDFIRKVANFKSKAALVARINKDISVAKRKILSLVA